MGVFSDLDVLIQQNSRSYVEYELIKRMLNEHINGRIPFDRLHHKAQEILVEWESGQIADAIEDWKNVEKPLEREDNELFNCFLRNIQRKGGENGQDKRSNTRPNRIETEPRVLGRARKY